MKVNGDLSDENVAQSLDAHVVLLELISAYAYANRSFVDGNFVQLAGAHVR